MPTIFEHERDRKENRQKTALPKETISSVFHHGTLHLLHHQLAMVSQPSPQTHEPTTPTHYSSFTHSSSNISKHRIHTNTTWKENPHRNHHRRPIPILVLWTRPRQLPRPLWNRSPCIPPHHHIQLQPESTWVKSTLSPLQTITCGEKKNTREQLFGRENWSVERTLEMSRSGW